MAAGILAKPGTKLGPCKSCEHIDCAQTRREAASLCVICNGMIGYEKPFVRGYDDSGATGAMAHEACLIAALDRDANDIHVKLFCGDAR